MAHFQTSSIPTATFDIAEPFVAVDSGDGASRPKKAQKKAMRPRTLVCPICRKQRSDSQHVPNGSVCRGGHMLIDNVKRLWQCMHCDQEFTINVSWTVVAGRHFDEHGVCCNRDKGSVPLPPKLPVLPGMPVRADESVGGAVDIMLDLEPELPAAMSEDPSSKALMWPNQFTFGHAAAPPLQNPSASGMMPPPPFTFGLPPAPPTTELQLKTEQLKTEAVQSMQLDFPPQACPGADAAEAQAQVCGECKAVASPERPLLFCQDCLAWVCTTCDEKVHRPRVLQGHVRIASTLAASQSLPPPAPSMRGEVKVFEAFPPRGPCRVAQLVRLAVTPGQNIFSASPSDGTFQLTLSLLNKNPVPLPFTWESPMAIITTIPSYLCWAPNVHDPHTTKCDITMVETTQDECARWVYWFDHDGVESQVAVLSAVNDSLVNMMGIKHPHPQAGGWRAGAPPQ